MHALMGPVPRRALLHPQYVHDYLYAHHSCTIFFNTMFCSFALPSIPLRRLVRMPCWPWCGGCMPDAVRCAHGTSVARCVPHVARCVPHVARCVPHVVRCLMQCGAARGLVLGGVWQLPKGRDARVQTGREPLVGRLPVPRPAESMVGCRVQCAVRRAVASNIGMTSCCIQYWYGELLHPILACCARLRCGV